MGISGTCTGTYDSVSFSYIISPNYPQNYDNQADCRWTIRTSNKRRIALNVTDFFTEHTSYSMMEAIKDTLYIYNGSNDATTPIEILFGKDYPTEILFTGKTAYLKFITNESVNKKGFKILVKAYGKQTYSCHFNVTCYSF